ncbi:hypothetical protein [Algoriphagus formosus]|uniref:hypothetical protein n=1 Tax=Algoriphagus formosus TaxID=2007308 RepID=UPI000C2910B7|nr:hypothetical protein [Algoriphagus formosus]
MKVKPIKCDGLRELLSDSPLYRKILLNPEIAIDPRTLYDFGFPFSCNCAEDPQTHLLKLEDYTIKEMTDHLTYGFGPGDRSKKYGEYRLLDEIGQRFIEKVIGQCQNCKKDNPMFLIEFFTEKNEVGEYYLYGKKIGQTPPYSVKAEGYVSKILSKENLDFYRKALMNLSGNYGIGAFVYFRRVVESELIKLLEQVSELDDPKSIKVKQLLEEHRLTHKTPDLLEEVYGFLPESLKGLGTNPFKLLYGSASVGVHKLSDSECLEKALSLRYVLDFVLKKIYEEKNEISEVKKHLKNLSID